MFMEWSTQCTDWIFYVAVTLLKHGEEWKGYKIFWIPHWWDAIFVTRDTDERVENMKIESLFYTINEWMSGVSNEMVHFLDHREFFIFSNAT